MRLRDDERAQSVQIGAVLLFATLVIAFSSYQAFVVPNQNEEVEFDHNRQVQGELQDLRNAIVSMAGGGSPQSTAVTLGTTYPSRLVAMNPPPAAGQLRTVGTTDPAVNVSVRNAAAEGETGDFWTGSARNYSTGALAYGPEYNAYAEAPTTVYEHSVLHNEFDGSSLVVADQTVVDGNRISLVALNGSIARTASGTTSVDARPASTSTRTISLSPSDADEPVNITLPSRLPVAKWNEMLADDDVRAVPGSVTYPHPFEAVTIELTGSEPYQLQLTKVGVGTGATREEPAYLTVVDSPESSVATGSSSAITVEVRDRFNNPVPGVTVNASAESGSLDSGTVESDGDGRAVFEYTASARGTDRVNFSVEPGYAPDRSSFDPERANTSQVTVDVDVSDGDGGGVSAFWYAPTVDNSGGLSDCSASACTFDVSEHGDQQLTLRAGTEPTFDDVGVQLRTSDGNVGTVSPESTDTDDSGNATTEFTANENGTVDVFFGSTAGRDLLELTVTGVFGSTSVAPTGDFTYTDQSSDAFFIWDNIAYEFDWQASDTNADLSSVRLYINESDGTVVGSAETDVDGGSASGTTALSGLVPNGCGDEYTLKMLITDQAGQTTAVTKTDAACS